MCLNPSHHGNSFSHVRPHRNESIQPTTSKQVRDIPVKPPLLATIKSNNYMINALTCEEAEDHVRVSFICVGWFWTGAPPMVDPARLPIDSRPNLRQHTYTYTYIKTFDDRAASWASSWTRRGASRRGASGTWQSSTLR